MASDWPLEIDGLAVQPVPESWIANGVDDRDGDGPQLLAVSVGVLRESTLKVRYAHPRSDRVGAVYYPATAHHGGLVPEDGPRGEWPRSVPASDLEPVDDLRAPEREHLRDLWNERVHEVLEDVPDQLGEQRLVADGSGRVVWEFCRDCGNATNGERCDHCSNDRLVTDGGHSTDRTQHIPDPVAAEEIDGVECQYSSCVNEADWLVEVEGWHGFVCCQRCSVKNRIYAKENELIKANVSEQARRSVDAASDRNGGEDGAE